MKIDVYIENIKKDNFYEGIIEISIFAKLKNINISVYTIYNIYKTILIFIFILLIYLKMIILILFVMEFENRNTF